MSSDLAVFLNYNFAKPLTETGEALALQNGHLTVINLKTASIWEKCTLWWTGVSFDKMKITKFIATRKDEWQNEALRDHNRLVAFEKQCIRITKFAKRFDFRLHQHYPNFNYETDRLHVDRPKCIKHFLENLKTIENIGTWTLHVKVQYLCFPTAEMTIEQHQQLIRFNRLTLKETVDSKLLQIIHCITGQYSKIPRPSYKAFELQISPVENYNGQAAPYLKRGRKRGR